MTQLSFLENDGKGMGGHHSEKMKNDEWLTPPMIVKELGPFDLDPCSPVNRPWDTAKKHYTYIDNGIAQKWEGRIWLNPPYGKEAGSWLRKLGNHKNGIALIFARTETDMFFKYVWKTATALLFIRGRLFFHYVDGTKAKANSGAPSVLIAYDEYNSDILKKCNIEGKYIKL